MAAADTIAAAPVAVAPARLGGLGRPLLAVFVAATVALAAVVTAPLLAASDWAAVEDPAFWALAGFVLLGELFPVRLPRRDQLDEITLSTPFAFALLLAYGPAPAIAAYVLASLIQDASDRTVPAKMAFNAAQYALSLAAAAGVLTLLGAGTPAGEG